MEHFQLTDKPALVTGAASGIGRAMAQSLAEQGCRVIATDLNRDGLAGLKAHAFGLDVTDGRAVSSLAAEIKKDFQGLDILVNCAGLGFSGSVKDSDPAKMEAMIRVNLFGLYLVCHHMLPLIEAQGRGDIVNLSSVAGIRYVPEGSVYSATKHAVRAFSEALRNEVQDQNIRVLTVYPGLTQTPLLDEYVSGGAAAPDPEKPILQPKEIAKAIIQALKSPPHLAINELTIRPVWQVR